MSRKKSTFFALPVEGMEAYRAGMEARMNLIVADARAEYAENEYYTQEQYDIFWAAFDAAGVEFVKGIAATVRRTLGSDIDASCGQLRRKYTKGN